MRELKRSIAREVMKRAGFSRINKKRASLGGRSYFSLHWREALAFTLTDPNKVYSHVSS